MYIYIYIQISALGPAKYLPISTKHSPSSSKDAQGPPNDPQRTSPVLHMDNPSRRLDETHGAIE